MPQPTVIGPYVVLRPLGSGGMGTVCLCEHRALGRRDAVKVPHPQILGDADALRRFEREAQVAAGFHHPHIAVVYDAALDHDPPYLAMAYVAVRVRRHHLARRRGAAVRPRARRPSRPGQAGHAQGRPGPAPGGRRPPEDGVSG